MTTKETDKTLALSTGFLYAVNFATTLHTETRKGTTIPYISHLYSVAALVMEAGGTEDEVIAALLHDAVEDHGGLSMLAKIRDVFGEKVADIVEGCTDDAPPEGQSKRPWRERKEAYISHIVSASHSVRLVSNADKLHNARCILKDYREIGDGLWKRFTGKRQGTLWYYRSLADAFLKAPADRFLSVELNRVVTELERLLTEKGIKVELCEVDLGGTKHWAFASVHTDGTFQIRGYDLGAAPQQAWNSDDYEFTRTVPPEGARRMLAEFVRERFESHPKAFGEIKDWLTEKGIESSFWAYP